MKKYMSLGELLVDYRSLNNITQVEFAAMLDVDIRTVNRWEKDITLIKSEKEEELVEKTFMPYQLIHNLNAAVAIPTYFDFGIRKYSLSELSNDLPDAEWFLAQADHKTKRIRSIEFESDIDNILRYTGFQYNTPKKIKRELIKEATRLLPELNLIIFDDAGYYAGHSVFFPLKFDIYQKLRNREMVEGDISLNDLVDIKNTKMPVFHNYDMAADCNENIYYIFGSAIRYIRDHAPKDYLYSSLAVRPDTLELNIKLGFKLIWEDTEEQKKLGMNFPPRWYEEKKKKKLFTNAKNN